MLYQLASKYQTDPPEPVRGHVFKRFEDAWLSLNRSVDVYPTDHFLFLEDYGKLKVFLFKEDIILFHWKLVEPSVIK